MLICAVAFVGGCTRAPENKEAIQAGVVEHLKKAGTLDLNQLDITVTDVKYQGNEATATVSFKPKSAPQQGMTMPYTLERRGDKWQVKGRGSGHGGAMGGMGGGMPPSPEAGASGQMPPGHPPMGGAAKGGGGGDLPPGHPPVNSPKPEAPKK